MIKYFKYFLVFVAILVVIVLTVGYFVMEDFKKAPAFVAAVEHAKNEKAVLDQCGEVTGVGFLAGGEIKGSSADFSFTVLGSKRNVKVYSNLSQQADGSWKVDSFKLR